MSRELVDALLSPDAWPHPVEHLQVVETHISWVILTGQFAYKIKKPVTLDFLDFSTLALRRRFCEEELRLNRRTAPQLYLDIVPITGSTRTPRVGGDGEAIEYTVRMRQFPEDRRVDRLLESERLSAPELQGFASHLVQLHEAADRSESSRYGDPAVVSRRMMNVLEQLKTSLDAAGRERLSELRDWTRSSLARHDDLLHERAAHGMVRECHGDLHLSNLVDLDGTITAFDCIEFDPALRWTDVIDDAAFLMMDLQVRNRDDLAYSFLDAYIAASGDFEAIALLGLYKVHRSLVRANVAAIDRAHSNTPRRVETLRDRCDRHLQLAQRYTRVRTPIVILMHGMSGAGKSWLSERLIPLVPALRLRSDLERKRLAGLSEFASSDSLPGRGLYGEEGNRATYARLAEVTRLLAQCGENVIVDAAFLSRRWRERFYELARSADVYCILIDCAAPQSVLEERVAARESDSEVSEAGLDVLHYQLSHRDPLDSGEEVPVLRIDTTQDTDAAQVIRGIKAALRL